MLGQKEIVLRSDIVIEEALAKCDVLKIAGIWPPEPKMRPRAWLQNFDPRDRPLAAFLLDKFSFYNGRLTDLLLIASYNSLGDGMPKGPNAPSREILIQAISSAVFTPVKGEHPNPTDSGYLLCRKARQLLGIPEEYIVDTSEALKHAYTGKPVVFIDDIVGSGDQFLNTWTMNDLNGQSFKEAQRKTGFVAIYITLVTTKVGLDKIYRDAPEVAVCAAHVLEKKSTIYGIDSDPELIKKIEAMLAKYSSRLTPKEDYIANNQSYLTHGYKNVGLMFGFEHSIPDSTLPIFWSPGAGDWEPLIERA